MKLGVYSLVAPDYKVDEAADLTAEIGYDGIEWTVDYTKAVWDGVSNWHIVTDNLEESARVAREAAERNGLAVPSLGTRCNCFDTEAVRRNMEAARLVNAKAIRVGVPRYDGSTHHDELQAKTRDAYAAVAKMAGEMGVKALVETHFGQICAATSAACRLLDGLDPDCVGVLFDPGNMVWEGRENYKMAMEMLGPYLHHVHVKNAGWVRGDDGKWTVEHMSPSEGMVDWKEVIEGLKSVGYDGFLDIEDFRGGYARKPVGITTRDKLQEDYDYLSALL